MATKTIWCSHVSELPEPDRTEMCVRCGCTVVGCADCMELWFDMGIRIFECNECGHIGVYKPQLCWNCQPELDICGECLRIELSGGTVTKIALSE